jgi:hypothetical protein
MAKHILVELTFENEEKFNPEYVSFLDGETRYDWLQDDITDMLSGYNLLVGPLRVRVLTEEDPL